ncbi:MAG: SpoIIIAH-like family protein [Bacillota bacterium]|jgi:stage III sporulation protein AH
MIKKKKMKFSDLDSSLSKQQKKSKRDFSAVKNEGERKERFDMWKKIKYFFSSDNKEAAQHLLVIFGVLVLILLSCAAVNKVENEMDPAGRQAVAESILNGGQQAASAVNDQDEKNKDTEKKTTQSADGEVLNNDNDYFINYEMEREKVRSEQLELLNEMVEGENTLPEVKQEAENKILSITEGMENELLLESLLVAKYGGEAVVFVQEDKVNVILRPKSGKIDDKEADKIAQLVDTYTDIGYENAIIVIKD